MQLPPFPVEYFHQPAAELAKLLYGWWVIQQASKMGIEPSNVTLDIHLEVDRATLQMEANDHEHAVLALFLRTAATGDYEKAGNIIKQYVEKQANDKRLIQFGLRDLAQKTDFGRKGAQTQKEKGAANRKIVLDEKMKILASWKGQRSLTDRHLARLIARNTGIPVETVRSHLKIRKDKKKMG